MMGKPLLITAELVDKVKSLRAYGLTLRVIGNRLGLAQASVRKLIEFPVKGRPLPLAGRPTVGSAAGQGRGGDESSPRQKICFRREKKLR